MRRNWTTTLSLALALSALPAAAQDDAAKQALARFQELRPTEADLAMYRLDWAGSLEEAKERAAKERRPIAVVSIFARYGDLFTGHC